MQKNGHPKNQLPSPLISSWKLYKMRKCYLLR